VLVGLAGQVAVVLIPRVLARSESEALLPEDVGPKVSKLTAAAEEFFAGLEDKRAQRIRAHADRLVRSGWHYVSRGIDPKHLPDAMERRAKKLPALNEADHAIAVRVASNLAEANMHAVRRGLEILLTAWVPLHLVTSAMALILLFGHIVTVLLW